jgi:hypothetical protein
MGDGKALLKNLDIRKHTKQINPNLEFRKTSGHTSKLNSSYF